MWHNKKKDINEQSADKFMDAMQYHSIPIVEKQIQIRSMHMVDERRAGGGSLVSL
jgi:hypothetical protein